MEPSDVDSAKFDFVVSKAREYCRSRHLTEAGVQHRRSILAACEDPATVSTYNHGGQVWPLPQTGQMQLECEILRRPESPGFYTVSYSYRNEPNPVPGRHDLIFPMFEFELKGDIETLIEFEAGLLRYLGLPVPLELKELDLNDPPEIQKQARRGRWNTVAKYLGVDDIDHDAERRIGEIFGPVFFLTHFPNLTSPFWNMKQSEIEPGIAQKVDVIVYGMETIGSAERSCNVEEMRHQFNTISDGGYANLLYSTFGRERVLRELDCYLKHNFIQRCGGGIGMTRLIRAVELHGLFPTSF